MKKALHEIEKALKHWKKTCQCFDKAAAHLRAEVQGELKNPDLTAEQSSAALGKIYGLGRVEGAAAASSRIFARQIDIVIGFAKPAPPPQPAEEPAEPAPVNNGIDMQELRRQAGLDAPSDPKEKS